VEFARNQQRQKRGGGAVHVSLDDVQELPHSKDRDFVALSDALSALATFDARMSQVVELRFFGGLTVDETADVLNASRRQSCGTGRPRRLGCSARSDEATPSLRANVAAPAIAALTCRFSGGPRSGPSAATGC
jgi:hypothetical protein